MYLQTALQLGARGVLEDNWLWQHQDSSHRHAVPCCGAVLWCRAVVLCCGAVLCCVAVVLWLSRNPGAQL